MEPPLGSAITSSTDRYTWHPQYGRIFQGFKKNTYFLPCDEQEQDRLDLFHKLITEARNGDGLLYSPHPSNARILDLGCGTGIWALDIAKKFPKAHVVGVDIAPIQPQNGPKNCDFYNSFNYDGLWELGEDTWDIIHMQMGCGSVAEWERLYRGIFNHLKPGAWFEQVEIDFEPRCNDQSLETTTLHTWYQDLKEATQKTTRSIAHSFDDTIKALEKIGFTEVDYQIVRLPLNLWYHSEKERTVALWYNAAFRESVESFTLFPFCHVWGVPMDYIRKITESVQQEANHSDLHIYNLLHIYRARKPMANSQPGSAVGARPTKQ